MSKIEKESASGYIFLGTMAFVLILMIGVFVFSDKEYNAEHKEAVQQDLQRQADERAITMVYSKDARTGLCYAFSGPYFTHVPCDKVQKTYRKQYKPVRLDRPNVGFFFTRLN